LQSITVAYHLLLKPAGFVLMSKKENSSNYNNDNNKDSNTHMWSLSAIGYAESNDKGCVISVYYQATSC